MTDLTWWVPLVLSVAGVGVWCYLPWRFRDNWTLRDWIQTVAMIGFLTGSACLSLWHLYTGK